LAPEIETKEVFLPARVLEMCLKNWEDAEDAALARAVGEAMEHAYWHWRWIMAVRQKKLPPGGGAGARRARRRDDAALPDWGSCSR